MIILSKKFYQASLAVWLATATALAWGGLEAGTDAYNGGDYPLAMHELMPLAQHGNAEAQNFVGQMYANGQGVQKSDVDAIFWYMHAADGDNSHALLNLADMYSGGKGVPMDDVLAAYWQWRAARLLVTAAQAKLTTGLQKTYAAGPKTPGRELAAETRCAAPVFQHDAQHFGESGTVDLVLLVDANGKVLDTSVVSSSEWPRLDRVAREAFGACSFTPAQEDGKPAPRIVRKSYAWKFN